MEQTAPQPNIPESFFEYRQLFTEPWVDKWTAQNPFISALVSPLRADGVELTDFWFNKDAANFGETYLNIAVRKLNADIRVGLDSVTFVAANPDWGMAPQLIQVFERVSHLIRGIVNIGPRSQEATLALHVTPGSQDFSLNSATLVNAKLATDAVFCGVSIHRNDSALLVDKSLKYPGAAFVRVHRKFSGNAEFSSIARQLFEDEVSALHLLGITGVV